jgi:hypothetical protein
MWSFSDGGERNRRRHLPRLAVASTNSDLVFEVDYVVDVLLADRALLPDELHGLDGRLDVSDQGIDLVLDAQKSLSQ